jgi:hypothetical protein
MYRGLILDNLTGGQLKTKKCNTEAEARNETEKSIERLCKKYHVEKTDNRFILDSIEISE